MVTSCFPAASEPFSPFPPLPVLHPASSTHRQLTDEQLVAAGITPGLIRLSVGLEHIDDILDDLKKGFAAIR